MDAKITKSRLANYLAYDWLKIMLFVALAVMVLCIFFTTVRTMPGAGQTYELYAYTNLNAGGSNNFSNVLEDGDVFSYEILETTFESFNGSDYNSNSAFMARRAAGQGTALLVCDYDYTVDDGEGNEVTHNTYADFIASCVYNAGGENERMDTFCDFLRYQTECERYLAQVFGENWRVNAEPDAETVKTIFTARNAKDKRFRTAAKRETGIALERERFIRLRADYLAVEELLQSGVYSYNTYTSEQGITYTNGIKIGGLSRLTNFVYYVGTDENGASIRKSDGITLLLFENGGNADLKFETFSLLRWFAEEYGA